jgi:hypothetical protein
MLIIHRGNLAFIIIEDPANLRRNQKQNYPSRLRYICYSEHPVFLSGSHIARIRNHSGITISAQAGLSILPTDRPFSVRRLWSRKYEDGMGDVFIVGR